MLDRMHIDSIIMSALNEDIPLGDMTTDGLIDADSQSKALFIAGEEGMIAGLDVSGRVFEILDERVVFQKIVKDGARVKRNDLIAKIEGGTRVLLKGERTALNFLQRLSGIATITNQFCNKIADLPAKVVDTRKTTPGLRILEKYAVRVGGGCNHRFSLSDGILIKDNHIKAAGSLKNAVLLAKKNAPHTMKIEVETESLEQVGEALESRADIIMLDNMSIEMMEEAIGIIGKRAVVEASGNININNIYDVARTGVDFISVGRITHSVGALDISMEII